MKEGGCLQQNMVSPLVFWLGFIDLDPCIFMKTEMKTRAGETTIKPFNSINITSL